MVAVLFVCAGNICRSPTAEGLFRHEVRAAGSNPVLPRGWSARLLHGGAHHFGFRSADLHPAALWQSEFDHVATGGGV